VCRFLQFVCDARRFLEDWGAEAARLGWSAADIFGVHPLAPEARYDMMRIVSLMRGTEVVAISEHLRPIRTPGGGHMTYYRHLAKHWCGLGVGAAAMNDLAGAEVDRLHDGRHLRAARILAGLTQQQLAHAAAINVNAVRYWEADDRSSEPWGYAIDKLVAALRQHGVEVATVFSDDNQFTLIRRRNSSSPNC
jgi:DNA-binding transcriptional regulator YiaG